MRIRWTPEEQQFLIEETAHILFAKNALSLREAFNKAQKKLPVGRAREIAALSQVPWLTDLVPPRLKELELNNNATWEAKLEAATLEARERGRQDGEAAFIATAGGLLAKIILSALQHPEIAAYFTQQPAQVTAPSVGNGVAKTTKVKKSRVIVAGVLNAQARKIEDLYKDKLDIKFWTKDQSSDTLRSMLHQADAAIGMVGFLSHSHDGILKASKIPYFPVSGGVTAIKQTLDRM